MKIEINIVKTDKICLFEEYKLKINLEPKEGIPSRKNIYELLEQHDEMKNKIKYIFPLENKYGYKEILTKIRIFKTEEEKLRFIGNRKKK